MTPMTASADISSVVIKELLAAVRRGVEDGTLDCVVRRETTNDGRPAKECPAIIRNPVAMCAGCRIRIMAGVPRRADS